jgi:sugar-specific transcriptional regulator TrmB
MRKREEFQQELEKFGLSLEQSNLYLCLVQEGEQRIQDLAKMTGLARSSVYEHLKILFKLGLAEEVIAENHKKIRPYPVSVLRHDLSDKIFNLQQLESELDTLEKHFKQFSNDNSFPSMSVRYYKNISGGRQVLWNSLKAKSEVQVYSAWGRSFYVGKKFYENFVDESKRRDIKEKVLLNPSAENLSLLREHLGTSVARTSLQDIRAISSTKIAIKGETLIYDDVFAQIYLRGQEINGFEIENKNFNESQRTIFYTLWQMAKPVQTLL